MGKTRRTIPHWVNNLRRWYSEEELVRNPIYNGRDTKGKSYAFERPDGKGFKEVYGRRLKRFKKRQRNKWLRRQKWPT